MWPALVALRSMRGLPEASQRLHGGMTPVCDGGRRSWRTFSNRTVALTPSAITTPARPAIPLVPMHGLSRVAGSVGPARARA